MRIDKDKCRQELLAHLDDYMDSFIREGEFVATYMSYEHGVNVHGHPDWSKYQKEISDVWHELKEELRNA